MPTKGTQVLTVRVPERVAQAIRDDAKRRKIQVNKVLSLLLIERFYVADDSQETDETSHEGETVRFTNG